MAREGFLLNLREAVRFLSPTAQANGIRLDPGHFQPLLRSATRWLTPETVEGFNPADFPELGDEDRAKLVKAVEEFREIARQVSSSTRATPQQVEKAVPTFLAILREIRRYLEEFQIYDALKGEKFPDYVHDFAVRMGEDSTGDPAVWLWVIVENGVAGREFISKVPEIRDRVQSILRREGVGKHLYLLFRTESEQRELEELEEVTSR